MTRACVGTVHGPVSRIRAMVRTTRVPLGMTQARVGRTQACVRMA